MKKVKYVAFVMGVLFFNTAFSYNSSNNIILKLLKTTNYYRSKYGLGDFSEVQVSDNSDRVIYGQDDRKDFYQLTDNQQKELANSVCLLTYKDNLKVNQNQYELGLSPYTESGFTGCQNEKFRQQKVGGWCTGFLVAPDVIATAGHCIENDSDAKNTAFVFGFSMKDSSNINSNFKANQVYYGKKLLAHALTSNGEDYALVQLAKKVDLPGTKPLKVRASGSANVNDLIGVIGYPSGLPIKITYGQSTRILESTAKLYRTNLDTYSGNSGSPVFNASSGLVEGILVRGASDFVVDRSSQCFRSALLQDRQGGEMATKSLIFAQYIPQG